MKKLTDYFWEYNATEQAFYVVEKFGDDMAVAWPVPAKKDD